MKKWEEERKKKQYADKISKVKPTLKTQPKGSKIKMGTSATQQGIGKYSESLYPSRGRADFMNAGESTNEDYMSQME